MSLEVVSFILLITLIASLGFIFFINNENNKRIKKLKDELSKYRDNKNALCKTIIDNLPINLWLIKNGEIVYGSDKNNRAIFEQIINSNKNVINHNKSKIQNIIMDGQVTSFRIDEVKIDSFYINYSMFLATDISQEEQLKRDLNSQIRMYRDLINASSSGIAFYSKDRKLVFYNDVFINMWSFDRKWLDNSPMFEDILVDLIEKSNFGQINIQKYKQEQLKMFNNLVDTYNDFLYLPDSRIIRVLVIPNSSGGLLFSYEDNTNKLVIEKSYNNLIKIYRDILEKMSEGIAIFSPSCSLYMYNKSFLQLFQFDKKFLNEKPHLSDIMTKLFQNSKNLLYEMIEAINNLEGNGEKIIRFIYQSNDIVLKIIRLPDDMILFLFENIKVKEKKYEGVLVC